MDTRKILIMLAFISCTSTASVELKSSDNEQLLVNGAPVQLAKHVYNADGDKIENFSLINSNLKDANVLVTLNEHKLILNIHPDGAVVGEYGQGNGIIDYAGNSVEGKGASLIYNESLDTLIGITSNSTFYSTQAVYLAQDNIKHGVYIKGQDIEGSVSFIDSNGGQVVIGGVTGVAIEYSQVLTDAFESMIDTLKAPLSIK